jgi:hypothetical protein
VCGCFSKQAPEETVENEKILQSINLLDTTIGSDSLKVSYREDSVLFIRYGELVYAEKISFDSEVLKNNPYSPIGVYSKDSILLFDGVIKNKNYIIIAVNNLLAMATPIVVYLDDNRILGIDLLEGGYFGGGNDGMVLRNDSVLICEYRTVFDLSSDETFVRVFRLENDTFSFLDTFVYIPKNKKLLEADNYNQLRCMQLIKQVKNLGL